MISPTAEYGLRAVVTLAAEPERPLTATQIAAATGVPQGYLSKVMQSLSKSGIVSSQRGVGGGFRLAVAADKLSVLDVVAVFEQVKRVMRCPLGRADHTPDLCPLHKRLDDAAAMVERSFAETTVEELLSSDQANPRSWVCEEQHSRNAEPAASDEGPTRKI